MLTTIYRFTSPNWPVFKTTLILKRLTGNPRLPLLSSLTLVAPLRRAPTPNLRRLLLSGEAAQPASPAVCAGHCLLRGAAVCGLETTDTPPPPSTHPALPFIAGCVRSAAAGTFHAPSMVDSGLFAAHHLTGEDVRLAP